MEVVVMPFGKYKGKLVEDLPSDYLLWVANNTENEVVADAARSEYQWRDDHNCHME